MSNPLVPSLQRAVEAAPDDATLRLHLAQLLVDDGQADLAVTHCAVVLSQDPASVEARALMARALDGAPAARPGSTSPSPSPSRASSRDATVAPENSSTYGFDWGAAEGQVEDVAPQPMFVDDGHGDSDVAAWDVERTVVRLADVGGMTQVKERLEAAFLAPMRNPELRRLYGKSLRGGMLLYGPPGCGKTFIGRAVAGEMGAAFINVGLSDVLDMYIGNSESNIHEVFELARRSAPVVVFLDELDALGQKRSMTRNSAMRGAVNQLLTELDGAKGDNEGVFVIGATNQPWDIDPALRRPGRLDRTLLVLPPDEPAREAIFRSQLSRRPVEGIDTKKLASITDGYSGADIQHICETASERALLDGVRTGTARMIGMADLKAAAAEVRPSTSPWFESARNVVEFANSDGTYDELKAYMRKRRR